MSAPIIAATFTIAFEGLMLFQGNAYGGKHAAIVSEPVHHKTPHIEIWRPDQGGTYTQLGADIPLNKDDHIKFDDTSPGSISTDSFYIAHVPHLADFIVSGHVHDDVIDETANDGVLAFVDLPAGAMTTFRTFKEKVRLTKKSGLFKKKKFCFARFVILKIPNAGPSVKITGVYNGPYDVKDGDLIIVSNISKEDAPHFHFYEKLLNKDGKLGMAEVLHDDKTCNTDDGLNNVSEGVKKVLNDLYNKAPSGDCGPTGNP